MLYQMTPPRALPRHSVYDHPCLKRKLHSRSKMLAGDAAAQHVVCIVLHTADGHVGCGLSLLDVKPNGNVLQLGALQFVNGAGIPRTDGIHRHVTAVRHIVRQGTHGKLPARLGDNMIVGLDGRRSSAVRSAESF